MFLKFLIICVVMSFGVLSCSKREEIAVVQTQMPDLNLLSVDGTQFSAKKAIGKPILLVYWATWCSSCVSEISTINSLYGHYSAQGLQVWGVSVDENPEVLPSAMQKFGIQYPVLVANDLAKSSFGGIESLPTLILISKTGTVVQQWIGAQPEHELAAAIQKEL